MTVGIDLSLTSTGICILTGNLVEPAQVLRVRSTGTKDALLADRADRIDRLAEQIAQYLPPGRLVIIEAPSFGQMRQSGEHQRAGLWWLLVTHLIERGHRVVEIPPATLKKYATGKGNAGKDEVLAAVVRRYPQVEVTGNDVADALVLAAMGARWAGEPLEESLPQVNLAAMEKVRWPS